LNNTNSISNIEVGKYILDTISVGMYNQPLMLYREYIQNSVDSIDSSVDDLIDFEHKIKVEIDGFERNVVIEDTGIGISQKNAWSILHDLGNSKKMNDIQRGFRGIGRLGGLGYCDKLSFSTKARGEDVLSISEWDCVKLRKLINNRDISINVVDLIKDITKFSQQKYKGKNGDHFFKVGMKNVKSTQDILLDVPNAKSYISQVCPVPFNKGDFSFSQEIDNYLRKNIPYYKTYNIYVNGEQIFKPYKNEIEVGSKSKDRVKEIHYLDFQNGNGKLAYGWIGKVNLLGALKRNSGIEGIRVRCGNIMLGDNEYFSNFYRESRFNNYVLGEIHIVDDKLIPNSRRDDFEDNEIKEEFFTHFIKEIGLPVSRKIRIASIERGNNKKNTECIKLIKEAQKIIDKGYLAKAQKEEILKFLLAQRAEDNDVYDNEKIDLIIKNLKQSKHILDNYGKTKNQKMFKNISEVIYRECSNKVEALKIIGKIIKK